MTTPDAPRLNRRIHGRPAAPVRIVHLGLGNFTRAHQLWYTEHATDAAEWGVAGFSGRSDTLARQLGPAEGLYHLATQTSDGDQVEVISALSDVRAGTDLAAWRGYFSDPRVVIVTSTVTEAGYVRNAAGDLDENDPTVTADVEALRAEPTAQVTTAIGKFVAGLIARRQAGPITFVPCDNVPGNGDMARRTVTRMAELVDPALADWMASNVTFVSTEVDRITPRATDEDIARVAELTGTDDPGLVVTEPFTEWVLAGEFAQGHPDWASAGALFVDDVEPYERRKLTLLNGSHSLMAYAGSIRGHATVFEAINDAVVRGWVRQWWDDAIAHLPLPDAELRAYTEALVARYENPGIKHLLAQIAADGSQKLPIRVVGTIKAHLADGRVAEGATRVVAAWVLHLQGHGAPLADARADEVKSLVSGDDARSVGKVLGYLGIAEDRVAQTVLRQMNEIVGR